MSNKYYISDIKYEESSQTLEVERTIDVVWSFFEVPKLTYEKLLAAEDKEEFYRQNIMEAYKAARNGEV